MSPCKCSATPRADHSLLQASAQAPSLGSFERGLSARCAILSSDAGFAGTSCPRISPSGYLVVCTLTYILLLVRACDGNVTVTRRPRPSDQHLDEMVISIRRGKYW